MSFCCIPGCLTKDNFDNDRCLSCYMCEKIAHIKCIKYKASFVDSLTVLKDCHWFCPECNMQLRDYAKCFKQANHSFISMEKSLNNLQTQFTNCISSLKQLKVAPEPEKPNPSPLNSSNRLPPSKKSNKNQYFQYPIHPLPHPHHLSLLPLNHHLSQQLASSKPPLLFLLSNPQSYSTLTIRKTIHYPSLINRPKSHPPQKSFLRVCRDKGQYLSRG